METPTTLSSIETTEEAKWKLMYMTCVGCYTTVRLTTVGMDIQRWEGRAPTSPVDLNDMNHARSYRDTGRPPTKHILYEAILCSECSETSVYRYDEDNYRRRASSEILKRYSERGRLLIQASSALECVLAAHKNTPAWIRDCGGDKYQLHPDARRYVTEPSYIDLVRGRGVYDVTESFALMIACTVRKFGLEVRLIEGRFVAKPGYSEIMWMT